MVQYSTEDRLYYQSVSLKYTSQIKEKALTVWESLLDSAAAIKPVLVVNHNTSEKEIMVQDEASNLYLINSTGRILWKLPLEGSVMGTIRQVDFYKNGRLQYLFNTRDGDTVPVVFNCWTVMEEIIFPRNGLENSSAGLGTIPPAHP